MTYYKKPLFNLAFLAALLTSCKEVEETKEEVLRPAKYEVIGTSNALNQRSFNAVAVASQETDLSFRSSGIIIRLNAKVGQAVRKGDLIAQLDNVQAELAYEQSVSALKSAESARNTAKSNVERVRRLYEKGSASLSDYEAAKNSFQSALDQYESAKRNQNIKQSQVNYGFIYAPADGVIASKNAGINENISAGQVIATLNSGEGINVEAGLPESVVNRVELGMSATVQFSAIEEKEIKANVIKVAPVLDATASTFPVELEITNPAESIKPGMIASVTFSFPNEGDEDEGIIVPVKAVGEDGQGNFVYLIESTDENTGIVKKQYIQIGKLSNKGFSVISGLSEGQKIATAGLQTLLDGQKVSL